jgi:hypothetical protein
LFITSRQTFLKKKEKKRKLLNIREQNPVTQL